MEQGGKIPLRPIGRTVALNGQPDHSRIPVPQNPALEAMARITEHLGGLLAEQSQKMDRQKAAMNNAELQNGIKEMQNELAQAQTAEEFDLCKKGFLGENGKPGTLMEKAKARLGSRLYSEWEKTDGAAFMKAAQIEADSQQLAFNRRLALANAKAALPGMVDNYVNARGNNALRQNIENNFAETISVLPPEKQAEFNAAFKHDADYAFAEKNFDIPENEDINATIERLKKFETDLYAKHDKTGMLNHWTNLRPEERRRFAEKAKAIRQGLEQHQQREKEKAEILKHSEEEKANYDKKFLEFQIAKATVFADRVDGMDAAIAKLVAKPDDYDDAAIPLILNKRRYLKNSMTGNGFAMPDGSIKYFVSPEEYKQKTKNDNKVLWDYIYRISGGGDRQIRKDNSLLAFGAKALAVRAEKKDNPDKEELFDQFSKYYDALITNNFDPAAQLDIGKQAVVSNILREIAAMEAITDPNAAGEALQIMTAAAEGVPVETVRVNNNDRKRF